MTRLPTISARQMVKFLKFLGLKKVRQGGSHFFFRHVDGRTATVPVHKGEDLGRGLTNKILQDIEVPRQALLGWLIKSQG